MGSSLSEVLLNLQALGGAQLNYLNAIRDYNKAQLRLLIFTTGPGGAGRFMSPRSAARRPIRPMAPSPCPARQLPPEQLPTSAPTGTIEEDSTAPWLKRIAPCASSSVSSPAVFAAEN